MYASFENNSLLKCPWAPCRRNKREMDRPTNISTHTVGVVIKPTGAAAANNESPQNRKAHE